MAEKQSNQETATKLEKVQKIQRIFADLFEVYAKTFNTQPQECTLRILDSDGSDYWNIGSEMADGLPSAQPRGRVTRAILTKPDGSVEVVGDRPGVVLVAGRTDTILPGSESEIYREILAHELIHLQVHVVANNTVQPPFRPDEVLTKNRVAYIKGFNVVTVVVQPNEAPSTAEATHLLDEWITQYFAFHLSDDTKQLSPALQAMKDASSGIDGTTIEGAQVLQQLFDAIGIDFSEVFEFYKRSDLRGFMALLDGKLPGLGKKLVQVGAEKNASKGLADLQRMIKSELIRLKMRGGLAPTRSKPAE